MSYSWPPVDTFMGPPGNLFRCSWPFPSTPDLGGSDWDGRMNPDAREWWTSMITPDGLPVRLASAGQRTVWPSSNQASSSSIAVSPGNPSASTAVLAGQRGASSRQMRNQGAVGGAPSLTVDVTGRRDSGRTGIVPHARYDSIRGCFVATPLAAPFDGGASIGGPPPAAPSKPGIDIVTRNPGGGPEFGDCGEFTWLVELSDGSAYPSTSWIVQHLRIRIVTWKCEGENAPPINLDYWEGFRMEDGKAPGPRQIADRAGAPGTRRFTGLSPKRGPDWQGKDVWYSGIDAFDTGKFIPFLRPCGRMMWSSELFRTEFLPPSLNADSPWTGWREDPKLLGKPWGGIPGSETAPPGYAKAKPDAIRLVRLAWACCQDLKFVDAEAFWSTVDSPEGEWWSEFNDNSGHSKRSKKSQGAIKEDSPVIAGIKKSRGW